MRDAGPRPPEKRENGSGAFWQPALCYTARVIFFLSIGVPAPGVAAALRTVPVGRASGWCQPALPGRLRYFNSKDEKAYVISE
jgi:hypothetical protein